MTKTNYKSGLRWYVLKVITGQEKRVKSFIEAEFAKKELKKPARVLIPSEKVYEVKSGKKKVMDKQFFPGYILLQVDLDDGGQALHSIATIPGVLGFLSTRGWGMSKFPVPVRPVEINKILGKVEESEVVTDFKKSFMVGESVKVIFGPFSGFIGDIQSIDEDRRKVEVMVKIFERNTPVELGFHQVEKIV